MSESFDVVVVGPGPTGLACAIEAQKLGLRAVNIDKGCLVNSLYNYPANMIFFTTPELLEIGDIPFTTAHQKPSRSEALEYYRKVTEHYDLDVRQYQNVERITGADNRRGCDEWDHVRAHATGSPHDHFEWHPSVIPANWPASSYGYTVIGPTSAVNPYPILVDICG